MPDGTNVKSLSSTNSQVQSLKSIKGTRWEVKQEGLASQAGSAQQEVESSQVDAPSQLRPSEPGGVPPAAEPKQEEEGAEQPREAPSSHKHSQTF